MTKPNAHEAINNAAAMMIAMGAKLYGNRDLLAQIKKEHKEYRGY